MVLMKCQHCKYEWDYNGVAPYYTSCPRCLYRVRIPKTDKDPWVITDEEILGKEKEEE